MASIQKRGNKWVAEVRTKGRYISKSHTSQNAAKDWAWEQERKVGRVEGIMLGKTLTQALERYAREVSPLKKGARWEMIRLERLKKDNIAHFPMSSIRSDDIDDWIDDRKSTGVKGSTINRELNLLSAVLTKARKKWKWLEINPMENVERPKNPPHRKKTYSPENITLILKALDYSEGKEVITQRQRIAVAFLLSIESAMRQGEIWGILAEHIHYDDCYVFLPDTKNGQPREVSLSIKAIKLLKSLNVESGRILPTSQASAGVIFRRALQLAEITGYTFHDARHTAITRLAKKLKILDLAKMVGHEDIRNLNVYYNPKPKDIADELD